VVKEITDNAPSSLSGMTPFNFRVLERHPQERGANELGITDYTNLIKFLI